MESSAGCLLCGSTHRSAVIAVKERVVGTGETFTVVRCGECGLFRTDPRPTRAEIAGCYPDHYGPHQPVDHPPETWLRPGLKGTIRRWTLSAHYGYPLARLERFRGRMIAALTWPLRGRYREFPPFRVGGRLVEVGCGNGNRLALLRGLGWVVQGVEMSERACRLAEARYGLQVFCGELWEACLSSASVDAVVMAHVIEHVHDPLATLREVRRVLRPGGGVVIETPNAASLGRRVFGCYWYEWDVPRHLFLFDARTLGLTCARAGLRLERVVYSPYVGDWARSLAHWCRDRGWKGPAGPLDGRPRGLESLLTPVGHLLAWAGLTGRMIAVAGGP